MLEKFRRFIYLHFQFGFKECASCNRFNQCDRKPYLHRCEDACNYGKVNGK